MIVSNKEILYINSLIENAVDLFHNFWPMTSFIHHNPLHGFEEMHFEDAVKKAQTYFHNRRFLSREEYQDFLAQGKIEIKKLKKEISYYCLKNNLNVFYEELLFKVMTTKQIPLPKNNSSKKRILEEKLSLTCATAKTERLSINFGFCDALDSMYGTTLCEQINKKLISVLMRHFDEGQASWLPLGREKGLYNSWRKTIRSDKLFFDKSMPVCRIIIFSEMPEDLIFWILKELKIPKDEWEDFFILQFGKLHGWTGFLRWRSRSEDYIYQKKHPAYLEDFLAIRLYFLYFYLKKLQKELGFFPDFDKLKEELSNKENFLRMEYNKGTILPNFIKKYETCEDKKRLKDLYEEYMIAYNEDYRKKSADFLYKYLYNTDISYDDVENILSNLKKFEENEGFIWQKAMENSYNEKIMKSILKNVENNEFQDKTEAQFFFCIDVRSESIRRAIESTGDYKTYGIGGFFGIPLRLIDTNNKQQSNLCPAVTKPKNIVYLYDRKKIFTKQIKSALKHIYHDLKNNTMSGYIMVETIGLLFGFDFLGKTFFPNFYMPKREKLFSKKYRGDLIIDKLSKSEIYSRIVSLQREMVKIAIKENFGVDSSSLDKETEEFLDLINSNDKVLQKPEKGKVEPLTKLGKSINLLYFEEFKLVKLLEEDYNISYRHTLKDMEKLSLIGFTFKEQLFYAKNALKLTGLCSNFSPVVVLCGHESKSQNNPYESALDCGACGGNSSDTNARVLSYILNKKSIRDALKPDINIPDDTLFVSALHNTVTDKVIIDKMKLPQEKMEILDKIQKDLDLASRISSIQRAKRLPFSEKLTDAQLLKFIDRNKQDWSQTRPEWGLATNHSFVIGPRELTKGIEFNNRVFLHSYDYKKDDLGYFLEIILSAPLVIGEWINLEHFFSSLDNKAFGSESKVYHNVVGKFGVVSGNTGDLRTGLAAQSVHLEGKIYHEPVRLLTFIDAPFYKYKTTIDKIKKVSELVYNEWIKVTFIDREENAFFYYNGNIKEWEKISFDTLRSKL